MSTNAFTSTSLDENPPVLENLNPEISGHFEHGEYFHDNKLLFIGGGVLVFAILFIIISNFGGSDLKASLANQAPASTENSGQVVAEQKTEIVYKDQYGNILTPEQVQNILHPKKTETVVLNTGSQNSGENIVKYPEISGEAVTVDTTKKTLYVKEGDAAKLLAENRLVKKIVDNRPMYIEPISGAIVELIKPIERVAAALAPFPPAPPSIKKQSSVSTVVSLSTGEIAREYNPSSSEIGR